MNLYSVRTKHESYWVLGTSFDSAANKLRDQLREYYQWDGDLSTVIDVTLITEEAIDSNDKPWFSSADKKLVL